MCYVSEWCQTITNHDAPFEIMCLYFLRFNHVEEKGKDGADTQMSPSQEGYDIYIL